MKRLITLPLVAVLAMLGMWLGGAAAAVAAPASCTSGSTGYTTYWKTPGHASVWFDTGDAGRSHPAECMRIRAKVESNQQHTAGFGARYYSGWIRARYNANGTRLIARASVPVMGDGSGVYKAWQQREWSDGSHRQQREIYPVPGSWGGAPATAVHTTVRPLTMPPGGQWTYRDLRALLRNTTGPFLICAFNHPLGRDRMGAYYYAMSENVVGRACDASREWMFVHKGNDSAGVPRVKLQAVADGEWMAATNGCFYVIRKADSSQNGTSWKLYLIGGDLFIANQKCSGTDGHGNPRYNKDLTTNNRPDNRWIIGDHNNPEPGDYIRMSIKIPSSSPMVHTTALVVPAGGHGVMITRNHRRCTAGVAGNYYVDQNVWATKFTVPKPSCAANWQQRGHAIWVQRLTGHHKTTNGGWVKPGGKESATGGLDTTWSVAKGEVQVRTSSTGTVHTICLLHC